MLSTLGAFQAGPLTGQDRDLLRFVATSFGTVTAGTLEVMLDGSDVELDAASEDIDAVAITADGSVALSTVGALSVTGLTAGPADVATFVPTQLGPDTNGTWDPALVFEGGPAGVVQLSAVELA